MCYATFNEVMCIVIQWNDAKEARTRPQSLLREAQHEPDQLKAGTPNRRKKPIVEWGIS